MFLIITEIYLLLFRTHVIYVAVTRVLTHGVGDDTAKSMKTFAHISRAVIQQIAHAVIKAEHGCRPG